MTIRRALDRALDQALAAAAASGALILLGPGVEDRLPPGAAGRHVPGGALLPVAEGARLAAPDLPVLAVGTDYDLYGAGLGPLLHAARRNVGVTLIVLDRGRGPGDVATVGPWEWPLRPLALALDAGATFVAQRTRDEAGGLPHLIDQALQHPGFSLINIWDQPIPRGKTDLDGVEAYDRQRRRAAIERMGQLDRLYTGVVYQNPDLPAMEWRLLVQVEPIHAVWTIEPEVWERILHGRNTGGEQRWST